MLMLIRGLWALSVLGALAGVYILTQVLKEDTAERQAYCSAVAIAFALVPYCLARAVSEVSKK